VERRIEAGDLRPVRPAVCDGAERGDLGRQVQRRKGNEILERGDQARIDEGGSGPFGAAVDDAMSHGVRAETASLEPVEEHAHGRGVIGHGRGRAADTIHDAAPDLAFPGRVNVEQRVLERGRPAVERQDAHAVSACSPGHAP